MQMRITQFQNGSGCIVQIDGAGNDVRTKFHGKDSFAKEVGRLETALGQNQSQSGHGVGR